MGIDLEMTMQWEPLVAELAKPYGIEVSEVLAIIYMESKGDPIAVNRISKATGLMQVMPKEAGEPFLDRPTQEDLKDPRINIQWGCKILAEAHAKAAEIGKGRRRAIYFYTGGEAWSSEEDFLNRYWAPFLLVKSSIAMNTRRFYKGGH